MGRQGDFYKYFMRREKPSYVDLCVANIYGYMKTGKTTLTRKIAARLEKRCEEMKWDFLYIEGRRQQDVLSWVEEHKDEIKGLDYIVIAYDDAGRFFLSREGTTKERRETLKDFMEIRHLFEEIGFRKGVLAVLFNIQFYRLLDKTLRNAPMGIWKSLVAMDSEDRKEMVYRLGWRYYYFLKVITKAMFIDGYRLKISDIKLRSSQKREEIYNWLLNFFNKYGIDATQEIPMEFVKRFAIVELFDDKFIIDTGNDISTPKNYVKIKCSIKQDKWLPRDREERDKILFWIGFTNYIFKDDPELSQMNIKHFMKILRLYGLGFRTETFLKLKKKAIDEILSDPDVTDYLHNLDLI